MRYAVIAGKERFELKEGDFPVKGTPLIRITHAGVCGTDLSTWKEGDHYIGLVPGHEYAGIIEEPGTSGLFAKGDRVAGYTQNVFNEACGHCAPCLAGKADSCSNRKVHTWKGGDMSHPGAFSEYTTWFPQSIFTLPDSLELDEAALIEPFTVGLHAVNLADVQPGDAVLVLGGGIIGLTIAEWTRSRGAGIVTVTEMNRQKIERIKDLGVADHVLPPDDPDIDALLAEASGGGYDIVFDCVGLASAINTGIQALKKEFYKKFMAVGLPHDAQAVNYRDLVLRQILLRGSKGHTYEEFTHAARAMADKRINARRYISTRFSLNDIQQGFEALRDARGLDVKAVVEMG